MIRALETLWRDQADILNAYRGESAGRAEVAVLPRAGGPIALAVFGRVSSVVSSDPDYGPHLLVVRQQWSGTPPTAADVEGSDLRCYPVPNRAVGDYSVNEYVRVMVAHGARVAEKLA